MELNRVKKDKNYADLLHNSLKKQVLKQKLGHGLMNLVIISKVNVRFFFWGYLVI